MYNFITSLEIVLGETADEKSSQKLFLKSLMAL